MVDVFLDFPREILVLRINVWLEEFLISCLSLWVVLVQKKIVEGYLDDDIDELFHFEYVHLEILGTHGLSLCVDPKFLQQRIVWWQERRPYIHQLHGKQNDVSFRVLFYLHGALIELKLDFVLLIWRYFIQIDRVSGSVGLCLMMIHVHLTNYVTFQKLLRVIK